MTTYLPSHPLVLQVSGTYGLRADLLSAQIEAESSGDTFALRVEMDFFDRYIKDHATAAGYKYGTLAACSFGLMQIMLNTAMEQGFDDRPERLFDPRVGMSWGAKYLKHCLTVTDQDYRRALARYNGAGTRAAAYASRVFALRDAQVKDAE